MFGQRRCRPLSTHRKRLILAGNRALSAPQKRCRKKAFNATASAVITAKLSFFARNTTTISVTKSAGFVVIKAGATTDTMTHPGAASKSFLVCGDSFFFHELPRPYERGFEGP